MKARSAEE